MNLLNQSMSCIRQKPDRKRRRMPPHSESGYAMIALIGIMMFALILTTAAVPQLKKELQREREEEMLWRAGQVISAIQRLNGQPIMGEEGLVKLATGVQAPGRINKIKYLRASALCDPLTSDPCPPGGSGTNWQLVHPGNSGAKDFLLKYKALIERLFSEGKINEATRQSSLASVNALLSNLGAGISQPGGDSSSGNEGRTNDQGNASNNGLGFDEKNLPVLGVVSKKGDRMFRNYYEAEKYNQAFFFPGIPIRAGGFISPLSYVGVSASGAGGADPRCPSGGVFIGDKCYGGLLPGVCSPPKRVNPDTGVCEEPPPPPPPPTPTPVPPKQ